MTVQNPNSVRPTPNIDARQSIAAQTLKQSAGENSIAAKIVDQLIVKQQSNPAQEASKQIASGQRLDVRV